MKLIIYGIILGIGKIIPGISGSLLAISLGVYQKAIHTITHFFDNFKENLKFIIKLGLGIIIGIILFSKIILYMITNYYFYSMTLFIGLIISSIIKHYKSIIINKKTVLITTIIIYLLSIIPNINLNTNTSIIYLLAGIIEVFSSLIPGISGTSLFMSLGIYKNVLELITNSLNIEFILNNITKYLNYILGMFLSFIITTLLIDYLYQKHKQVFENIILGLSLGSIIILLTLINWHLSALNIVLGIFLFALGIFTGLIL